MLRIRLVKVGEQSQLKHSSAWAVLQHYSTNENFSSWKPPTTAAAVHRSAPCVLTEEFHWKLLRERLLS